MIDEIKDPGYADKTQIQCKFIKILLEMLENESINHIIAWGMDGTYFTIYNVEEFIHKVMFTYFKHNRFANFIRLLNMYNFKKVKALSNTVSSAYKNIYFIRNQPHLLSQISRNAQNRKIASKQIRISESHNSGSDLRNCVATLTKRIQTESFKTDILLKKNRELYQHLSNDFYYIRNLETLLGQLVSQLVSIQSANRSETNSRSLSCDIKSHDHKDNQFPISDQGNSLNHIENSKVINRGKGNTLVSIDNNRNKGDFNLIELVSSTHINKNIHNERKEE